MRLLQRFRLNSMFIQLLLTSLMIMVVSFVVFHYVSNTLVGRDMASRQQKMEHGDMMRTVKLLEVAAVQRWGQQQIRTALEVSAPPKTRCILIADPYGRYVQIGDPIVSEAFITDAIKSAIDDPATSIRTKVSKGKQGDLVVSTVYVPSIDRTVISISSQLQHDFQIWQKGTWLAILIALLVATLFSLVFSRKMTFRIRQMSSGAERFAKGRFEPPIQVTSKDELGQLAVSLNQMAVELGQLDQMRKDFVANVSHDLRSPLTSIHGYIEAVLDGTVPPESASRYLRIAQEQTQRLMKLVNDLLDMSKIEAGQFDVRPITFDLAETIRKVLARMEPTFRYHVVRFTVQGENGSGVVKVIGDPDRLEQVMVNLVQNAMTFSPRGTSIDILLDSRERVYITVRDEGIGMSEAELERIWERFYKSDEARSSRGGTGIGLSIVKHILDAHSSIISVESKLGAGSSFMFSLPKAVE